MRRFIRGARLGAVGTFFTGILGVIQGCDAREGALFAFLLFALNFCTGPVASTTPEFTLTLAGAGTGDGMMSSSGIFSCISSAGTAIGPVCSRTAPSGTVFAIEVGSGIGSVFAGWAGCDSTSGPQADGFDRVCNVTLTKDTTVTATFTGGAPIVTTNAASGLSVGFATLNGTVNANGNSTTVVFEYGPTNAYGTTVTADQNPVTGTTNTAVTKLITGLVSGATYHYRVIGTNAVGTVNGVDMTFVNPVGCFTADMQVLMADGDYKRVVDVQVGDMVMTYDFNTRTQVPQRVEATYEFHADSYLRINDLEVTATHPFAIGEDQWLAAGQLSVGDRVYQGFGFTDIVRIENVIQSTEVYTLTVSGTHNFYVSDGVNLYLVHNK